MRSSGIYKRATGFPRSWPKLMASGNDVPPVPNRTLAAWSSMLSDSTTSYCCDPSMGGRNASEMIRWPDESTNSTTASNDQVPRRPHASLQFVLYCDI
jgi:hypothetical protein